MFSFSFLILYKGVEEKCAASGGSSRGGSSTFRRYNFNPNSRTQRPETMNSQWISRQGNETFAQEPKLPRLPVPSLKQTAATLVRTLAPFAKDDEELAATTKLVEELVKSPTARARQEYLEERARRRENWLSPEIWLAAAYHSWTAYPLPGFSSVCGWLFMERFKDLDQAFSAAACSHALLRFKDAIDAGKLPVAKDRKGRPLSMDQWGKMFGTTRLPGEHLDRLVQHKASSHIAVLCRSAVYKLDAAQMSVEDLARAFEFVLQDTSARSRRDGQQQLNIGALTGLPRRDWARERKRLLSLSPSNAAALDCVESSAFCVCLDTIAGERGSGSIESDTALVRSFLLGGGGEPRWFDKSFQLIVRPSGQVGMNVEHSWAEASVPMSAFSNPVNAFCRRAYAKRAESKARAKAAGKFPNPLADVARAAEAVRSAKPPAGLRLLEWENVEAMAEAVSGAEASLRAMSSESDLANARCLSYNAVTMKKTGFSPDTVIQMAIQLAFYRLWNRVVSTYETCVLTSFRLGRTAACRVVSVESKAFCKAMAALDRIPVDCSASTSSPPSPSRGERAAAEEDCRAKFAAAAKAHISYIKAASTGRGVDRHLLALRMPLDFLAMEQSADPLPPPPPPAQVALWDDDLFKVSSSLLSSYYTASPFCFVHVIQNGPHVSSLQQKRAQTWELSTSNNSYLDRAGMCIVYIPYKVASQKLFYVMTPTLNVTLNRRPVCHCRPEWLRGWVLDAQGVDAVCD